MNPAMKPRIIVSLKLATAGGLGSQGESRPISGGINFAKKPRRLWCHHLVVGKVHEDGSPAGDMSALNTVFSENEGGSARLHLTSL
jgi:hypothetical protein